ncbi:BTAD domain-containing putative transcriptional regulator [Actinoplanes sp. NPDC026619]|uniref:AfsR/SARP family transcriptional regulator n=1 Tax=Actinoplanes sp. NPDC026619 TaxID=3155798 RepID=UPI0033E20E04
MLLSTMIEVRVLGPVEVRVGGAIRSGADRQLAVLAMLVAANGRAVSADRLADQLWPAGPPPSAAGSLQAYISRLRRQLEPDRLPRAAPKVLVSEPAGYALRLGDDAVDSWALERALGAAPRMPPERALALLREHLAGWRGTPYEQFTDEDWARPEIARLDELRGSAQERMIEAMLRAGRPNDAVVAANALTDAQPLRGAAWRLLAIGLWLANRSADALEALRRHRRYLAEELGLDPERDLVRLAQAIREQRPELLDDDVAVEAMRATNQPGGVRPAQLPRPSAAFAGREAELRRLTAQADAGSVLTVITGPGGVGKTTLALRWAHRVAARYDDGQLYADLRGFGPEDAPAEPGEILAGFLGALGIPDQRVPPGLDERVALYRSVLAGRRMLLVLDNARSAAQVRPLLPGTPGCAVVVTCRGGLTGLVLAEGARPMRLDAFTDEEARAYLGAADSPALDVILARCGGLPLALAVVAARAAEFPLAAVAAELADDGLDAFAVPGVKHDLRTVFSWSYRHLPDDAAALFRRLALHPGPDVTLAAATAVAGGDRAGTRRLLRLLCDAQLLTERQPDRFGYHDLLRAYATELAGNVDSAECRRDVLRRLAEHHLYSAAGAAKICYTFRARMFDDVPESAWPVEFADGDERGAMSWLESEYDNLMAVAEAWPAFSAGFAWALADFQQDLHFMMDDSIRLARAGLPYAERDGERWWISYLNYLIGRGHLRHHQPAEARPALERSVEIARGLDDPIRLGHGLLSLALSVSGLAGVPTRERAIAAYPYAVEAGEHYRKVAESQRLEGESNCLIVIGWFHYYGPGGISTAIDCFRRSVDLHERTGNVAGVAATWVDIGRLQRHSGDIDAAMAAFETALEIFGESSYQRIEPLVGLYGCHRDAGDERAAQQIRAEAVGLMKSARYPDLERLTAALDLQ